MSDLESNSGSATRENRRKNLRRILADRFDGNVAALARACQKAQTLLHGILKEGSTRSFGEKLAGDIEKNMNMPTGCLDKSTAVLFESDFTVEEDLFLNSIRKELKVRNVPSHMMQTVLFLLHTTPLKN